MVGLQDLLVQLSMFCILDGIQVLPKDYEITPSRLGRPMLAYGGYQFRIRGKCKSGFTVYCSSHCHRKCRARGVVNVKTKVLHLLNPNHTHPPNYC